MAGKFTTAGALTIKSVGKTGVLGDGVDATVSSSTKRTVGGVDVTLKASEELIKNKQSTVATITASKKIDYFTPSFTAKSTDLKAWDATLTAQGKTEDGKVDVKGVFTYKKRSVVVDIVAKPVKTTKFSLRLQSGPVEKMPVSASGSYEKNGFTVQPTYQFAKKAVTLDLSKKVEDVTLKAAYGFQDEAVALSVARKPITVVAKSTAGPKNGLGWPSLSLVLEGDIKF